MGAIIEPGDAIVSRAGHRSWQIAKWEAGKACVLCFGDSILDSIVKTFGMKPTGKCAAQSKVYRRGKVSALSTGIGCPSAALVAEKIIAAGCRYLLCLGFCGSISKGLRMGEVLMAEEAESDEGLSHHYFRKGVRLRADGGLLGGLEDVLRKSLESKKGNVWTTDAFYRETGEKLKRFREKGCLGVDMETAGVYAIAKYRKARAAAVLIATDELFDFKWERAAFGDSRVRSTLKECCASLKTFLSVKYGNLK